MDDVVQKPNKGLSTVTAKLREKVLVTCLCGEFALWSSLTKQFVPGDQVFPTFIVGWLLLLHKHKL